MKMDKDFAMIAGILFVMILLALAFSSSGITGFYKSSRGLVEYPYEGFTDLQSAYEMRKEGLIGTIPPSVEGFEHHAAAKKQGFKTKVEGFEGLQSGPIDEQIIGFMYNNEASTTCKGYGYTTSKGNICLTDSDIKLLTTRGMNATGVSDQIGA
jgi:hypothetical protein